MLKVLLIVIVSSVCLYAFNGKDTNRYECKSGNCVNGSGTVLEYVSGISYSGEWKNGNTIPGLPYRLSHPKTRGEKLEIYFSEDGLPEKGTSLRSCAITDFLPRFTGNYKRIQNPFLRGTVGIFKDGVYDTGMGIEYRGRFDYIPAKGYEAGYEAIGYFIFYGDKVDIEENETTSGLFISDVTYAYAPIQFFPARPDYLALLHTQYLRDLNIASDDFKQQENTKMWKTAFKVFFEVGQVFSGNSIDNLSNHAKNDFVIDLVSSLMNNTNSSDSGDAVIEKMSETILTKITGDKAVSKKLSKAVIGGITKAHTDQ